VKDWKFVLASTATVIALFLFGLWVHHPGPESVYRRYTVIAIPAPGERHIYHTFRWENEPTGGISFINADTGKRVVLNMMPRIIEEQ